MVPPHPDIAKAMNSAEAPIATPFTFGNNFVIDHSVATLLLRCRIIDSSRQKGNGQLKGEAFW
jgi:hypothetical protein